MAANLPKDQFELARQRATQRASQQASEQKGALQRRFAQLGTLQGGERLKLEQQTDEQANQIRQEAEESIQAAEVADAQRKQEIKEGREFTTSERLGSQDFAAKMQQSGFDFSRGEREASQLYGTKEREASQLYGTKEREAGQLFATGEREAGQKFVASEALKNRDFATAEREASQEFAADQAEVDRLFQAGESDKARTTQRELFYKQLRFEKDKLAAQLDQFTKTFEEERRVTDFNMEQANKPEGRNFMEKLLDPQNTFGKVTKKWMRG